jgi:NADPH:quinone reductase-like Zn-dependent oxidoreductase
MTSASSKIRAYQLDKLGSLDGLVLAERDMPSPSAGEVLVRVRASSLNFRDMMILNGAYPAPVPPGRVPLSDGSGEVVEVSASVKRFKVGDRVCAVTRRRFPVGANPTRRPLQPEATGAAMEVTK